MSIGLPEFAFRAFLMPPAMAALRVLFRFELKGTRPADKAFRPIARHLTAETTRAWKLVVPPQMTGGREVFLQTVMVIRKHLPERHLAASFFPLIACRRGTAAAMILSKQYWAPELLEAWEAENA